MTEIKRIGILTSGGDCPGLNAVIRAVVKAAAHKAADKNEVWQVYGIPSGTDGFIDLVDGKYTAKDFEIDEHRFNILGQEGLDILLFLSGSVLGCRGKKALTDAQQKEEEEKILQGYELLRLDALIAIGGDGSLDIIYNLAQERNNLKLAQDPSKKSELERYKKWNLIGIPKTIDNDVPFTERVIGFNTAVDIVATSLYNLTFTAASHDRVMIAEVMGRDAGHLALHAGIAGGADVILIPELTPKLDEVVIDKVCDKIAQIHKGKRNFALIAIAEGVRDREGKEQKDIGIGNYLKKQIENSLAEKVEMKVTILGHLQRSSPPSSLDRLLASNFGVKAVDLIDKGEFNQMVVLQEGKVQNIPLEQVMPYIHECRTPGQERCSSPVNPGGFMVKTARDLDICLGI